MVLSQAPGRPPTRLTWLLPGHPLLKQAGRGSSTPPPTLNQHLWSQEGAGSRRQRYPRCEHHQVDGPQIRRRQPAFPARKGSGGGQCPGGESPAPAGDRRRVRGDRSGSVPEAGRAGRRGRNPQKLPAARRTPRSWLCSVLFSPNWKDHISPRFTLWAVQVHPSKAHEDGGVFPFSVLSQRRLGEGRLFPASKTVRNSLAKSAQAPCTLCHLGAHGEGGLCVGGCPPSTAGTRCTFPPVPSSGPGPPQLTWPRANEGPGAPAHPGDGSSSPTGGERRGQTDRVRPRGAGGRRRGRRDQRARRVACRELSFHLRTRDGTANPPPCPLFRRETDQQWLHAVRRCGLRERTLRVDKQSRAKGWVCLSHKTASMVSPRKDHPGKDVKGAREAWGEASLAEGTAGVNVPGSTREAGRTWCRMSTPRTSPCALLSQRPPQVRGHSCISAR